MQPEQDQQPSADDNYQPQTDTSQVQPPTEQPQAWSQPAPAEAPVAQPVQSTPEYIPPQQQAPQYAPAQANTPEQPTEDPGKVFSIIGIIAAFIFMQLPGLILSIIGYKKSKKAGHRTALGTIGIWLNAVGLVLSLAFIAFFIVIAYVGVQQRATESSRATAAMSIMKKAEVYSAMNSTDTPKYPTIEELRAASGEAALTDEENTNLKDTDQPTGDEIGYKTCTDSEGAVVGANIYLYSDYNQQAIYHGSAGFCVETTGADMIDDNNFIIEQQ